MKKKVLILLTCICLLLLGGCGKEGYRDIYIDALHPFSDMFRIDIDNDYIFRDFRKEYTEDGCIMTLYYDKLN